MLELTKYELRLLRQVLTEKQVDTDVYIADLKNRDESYKNDIKCLTAENDTLEDIVGKINTEIVRLNMEVKYGTR